ncbi:MAG: DNA repair protein RecN [marine bacterium B5-7]|nr:MAG: DNA repair protein RecN [marine bacterium B5-7]
MLTHLHVTNFTIIDEIAIELDAGMSVLTGETGAGKSILLDALVLALGYRANAKVIRQGAAQCQVTASFSVQDDPAVCAWLDEQALASEGECVLRRVINQDGRSRAYVNGTPVSVQQLRDCGSKLLAIHGQHENQTLMQGPQQRKLFDSIAGHPQLVAAVAASAQQIQSLQTQIDDLQKAESDRETQLAFLQFQVQELDKLQPQPEEYAALDQAHKTLANASELITSSQSALDAVDALSIGHIIKILRDIKQPDTQLQSLIAAFDNADIQLQEARHDLQGYFQQLNLDPEKLHEVEQRLSALHDCARKHRIQPKQLYEHHQQLQQKLKNLTHHDEQLAKLQQDLLDEKTRYATHAKKLRQSREKAAKPFSKQITASLQALNMTGGEFHVAFTDLPADQFSPHGQETVAFCVRTNPGQPLQPLSKVVSGGELARISLAICVHSTKQQAIPSLIFDEVDTGIGGKTAAIVGQLLQTLSLHVQVLCVTHLPQVAAYAANHFTVSKQQSKDSTHTTLTQLTHATRVEEIGRMLGGVNITEETLAHAKTMLSEAAA